MNLPHDKITHDGITTMKFPLLPHDKLNNRLREKCNTGKSLCPSKTVLNFLNKLSYWENNKYPK